MLQLRPPPAARLAPALLLLAVLLASTLPHLAAADCCLAVTAVADPNAPQSYLLRAQGKSSSFFINNKVYEIKALFPNNYATSGAPGAMFPLSSANCTQSVAPPDNNPNLFTCFYSTTNPTNSNSFGLQWSLVVPPPGPGQQVKPPDFVSLSVNGDDACTRASDIDACPDPLAPGASASGTGGASLTMSTIISLGPFGQLPFWLLLVVCAVIFLMFAGFFYTCWRNHRGNPEERRRASMAMASRSPSAAPTLPKDDGGSSNPQDANWWRRHAATQKRNDSGATLTPQPDARPAPPAPTADAAIPLSHSRSRSSGNHTPLPGPSASNAKPTLITIPDDRSSDSDKPILAAHLAKPRTHLMNEPVPPALEPPTLASDAASPPMHAAYAHKKSPHLNPVLTSKGELEIPTTVGRKRSYRRAAANEPPTSPPTVTARASPATRPAPAPATLGAPAQSLSRSPSNSRPQRRAPPTSAAAVAAAITHRGGAAPGAGVHEVSSTTTGSDEYEDPTNLAAMGIRPNSPEKNDRIRNWAGAIAAVKEEEPAGGDGADKAARDVVSESEEEPIGLTLGRAGSGSASYSRQRVLAAQHQQHRAADSDSDEEAPLALSMARPRATQAQQPAQRVGVIEEDSDEEVPLAAAVARGNSAKIRPRAPLQIQGQSQQQPRARDAGVDDVIDSYLK